MTNDAEDPVLSVDQLRLLESIVRDETRSMDERGEAIRRRRAELDLREGLSDAEYQAATKGLERSLHESEESMVRLTAAMKALSDDAVARLTPTERAQVVHPVEHDGQAILNAIVRVSLRALEDGERGPER